MSRVQSNYRFTRIYLKEYKQKGNTSTYIHINNNNKTKGWKKKILKIMYKSILEWIKGENPNMQVCFWNTEMCVWLSRILARNYTLYFQPYQSKTYLSELTVFLTYQVCGDTDTHQTEAECISSFRLMESQLCCYNWSVDALGDFSWQPQELRHSTDPHIKDGRIREDRGGKGSSIVPIIAAHMYTPDTCQDNASFIRIWQSSL